MSKSILFAMGQIVTSAILTFLLFAWTSRVSGLATIGLWGIILGVGSVTRFSELGLGTAAIRYVAIARINSDESKVTNLIGTVICAASIFVLIAALALFGSLYLWEPYLEKFEAYRELEDFTGIILASLALSSIASVISSCLDGLERFDLRVVSVISGQLGLTIIGIWYVEEFGIKALVIGLLIQAVVTIALGLLFIARALRVSIFRFFTLDFVLFKPLIGYGGKIAGNSALILLFDPFTKFMLAATGGLSVLGAFEIANQVIQKFRSVLSAVLQVLTPRFAALSSGKEGPKAAVLVLNKTYELLLPTLFIGFSYIYLSSFTIAVIFSPAEREFLATVIQLLCFCWLVNTASLPAYLFNIGSGHAGTNLQCFTLMTFLNIAIAYLLGEKFAEIGIFLAYGLSLSIGGTFLIFYIIKSYGFCIKLKINNRFYESSFYISICWLLIYWLRPSLDSSLQVHAVYSTGLTAVAATAIYYNKNLHSAAQKLLNDK